MSRDVFFAILDQGVTDECIRFAEGDTVFPVGGSRSNGAASDIEVRVNRPSFYARVLADGNLGLGEAYIDEDFAMARGGLEDFLTVLMRNRIGERIRPGLGLALKAALIRARSRLRGKAGNVVAHYDAGADLFENFLDSTMTYSCGYAQSEADDLEAIQQSKLDRVCRKLRLEQDHRLLDIGCGFGGLLIHAAERYGVRGTGVTLSPSQLEVAQRRIYEQGLAGLIQVKLIDFREVSGEFDRIVSVGMMEHVPSNEYDAYFETIQNALAEGGLALVHTIGCGTEKNVHDPYIQKYVFPGSNQPRLSTIASILERKHMPILDVENMAPHYFHTVKGWLALFRANEGRLDPAAYDERFRRMWEYYLCCCVAATQYSKSTLYQVLFGKNFDVTIPLQRV